MIIGIGTDVVYIPRIENLYKKFGDRLIRKILSQKEQDCLKITSDAQLCSHIAKRFAAKEAFVKAIGTGFRGDISLADISVLNNQNGKPYFLLSSRLNEYVENISGINFTVHLSLSDEYPVASAFTILESKISQ